MYRKRYTVVNINTPQAVELGPSMQLNPRQPKVARRPFALRMSEEDKEEADSYDAYDRCPPNRKATTLNPNPCTLGPKPPTLNPQP